MQHEVRILKTGFVTHDTKSFVVEKPEGYGFSNSNVNRSVLPVTVRRPTS